MAFEILPLWVSAVPSGVFLNLARFMKERRLKGSNGTNTGSTTETADEPKLERAVEEHESEDDLDFSGLANCLEAADDSSDESLKTDAVNPESALIVRVVDTSTDPKKVSDSASVETNTIEPKRLIRANKRKRLDGDVVASDEAVADYGALNPQETSHVVSKEWSELHLSRPLLQAISDLGFKRPTPIQAATIPVALLGRDVLGAAETGSGKTAAFLLPTMERLLQSPGVRARRMVGQRISGGLFAIKALILLPTRELAVQCLDMLEALAAYCPITRCLVAGGMNLRVQEAALRQQPDIVIATPGRVLDLLINSRSVHMELLEIVIFDEADRLLDLGFKAECMQVLKHCAPHRQTLLFSATMNEAASDLATLALNRPVHVTVNPPNSLVQSLVQEFIHVKHQDAKEAALLHLCTKLFKSGVIVFFQTKWAAHRAALIFRELKLSASELHGNLSQATRLEALNEFTAGKVDFLLASELASRGLDIKGVTAVINVGVPMDVARYVHRVGRTARMGNTGKAVTIFADEERNQAKKISRAGLKQGAERSFITKKIVPKILENWIATISDLEPSIKRTLEHERAERELRLAEMEAKKAENISAHSDEIMARPMRVWPMKKQSKLDKSTLKSSTPSRSPKKC